MMHISKDFHIKCDRCGSVMLIEADSLEYETTVYDRQMGGEIGYDFRGDICCDVCHSWIECSIRGYEYPVGVFNFSDSECFGGCFVDEPIIEIDYEFDDDYYNEAYAEYEKAEYLLEDSRERIKRMSARDFEFFVANIFEKIGFNVKITQATRDGGKDIIATKMNPIPYTLIVECKHWGENHKVDVSVVRSVYGAQMAMQANQSVVVTSSKFTKDARKFVESQKTMMALWDIDDLLKHTIN